ncbi:unnamed protein product [Cyprideis torosa]|uniref:Uncharacterized protein n=1 Tax=Cyprideis torosa TaxID=163714 RepID=A0A7R8ZP22_9CRUS|nr:unnamed protein product [Cyprideis torosa]CAG0892908.1 unnamed protein product [Cyprideis torosa]
MSSSKRIRRHTEQEFQKLTTLANVLCCEVPLLNSVEISPLQLPSELNEDDCGEQGHGNDELEDEESSSEEDEDVVGGESFSEGLRNWAIEHNISHRPLNALLKLLRQRCPELPKDSRTLLKTDTIYPNFQVYNVHSLIHLGQDAMLYGNLDNVSAFPFEDYMQKIKRKVKTGNRPLSQIVRRIEEERMYCVVIFAADPLREVADEFTGVVCSKWLLKDRTQVAYPGESKHVNKALNKMMTVEDKTIHWEIWNCRVVKNSFTDNLQKARENERKAQYESDLQSDVEPSINSIWTRKRKPEIQEADSSDSSPSPSPKRERRISKLRDISSELPPFPNVDPLRSEPRHNPERVPTTPVSHQRISTVPCGSKSSTFAVPVSRPSSSPAVPSSPDVPSSMLASNHHGMMQAMLRELARNTALLSSIDIRLRKVEEQLTAAPTPSIGSEEEIPGFPLSSIEELTEVERLMSERTSVIKAILVPYSESSGRLMGKVLMPHIAALYSFTGRGKHARPSIKLTAPKLMELVEGLLLQKSGTNAQTIQSALSRWFRGAVDLKESGVQRQKQKESA